MRNRYGYPHFYHRRELDAGSKPLREKLQVRANTTTQIFMPQLLNELGRPRSTLLCLGHGVCSA